jgi:hypothetical protein
MKKTVTKKELAMSLYSAGRTIPEIASTLKATEESIRVALNKPGIPVSENDESFLKAEEREAIYMRQWTLSASLAQRSVTCFYDCMGRPTCNVSNSDVGDALEKVADDMFRLLEENKALRQTVRLFGVKID